ncbi:MAG: MATE family efflux transporter [Polyangiaceae bacterium]|nr:MATE family efflux transporter [Polyangiaceae bacterium]
MPTAAAPSSLLDPTKVGDTRAASVALDVWRLAWPAIGHMFLLTAVFAVDRLVLGRTDTTALASLQISTVLVWTITSIFTAFSTGTLAVAGRAYGAGDRRAAARAVGASLLLALGLGAVVSVVTLLASSLLIERVFPHAGVDVLRDVQRYLIVVVPVLPLAFVEATAAAALQAAGDTRTPLLAAAASNLLNLTLSCVLVFGLFGAPTLGVRGAAIGAAAAIVLQAFSLVAALLQKDASIPLRGLGFREACCDRAIIGRLVRISIPAFADKIVYAGGYLAFVVLVAWLGPLAMAANQAVVSVEAICFLSAEGFGIAAGALAAQSLGAGAPDRAEQTSRVAASMAVAFLSLIAITFVLAPRSLLDVFSPDGAVVEAGASSLILAAAAQPFMAYAIVMRMALRGAGATGSVLAVTLAGTFLVRLPVAYLASFVWGWGLTGIWLGSTLDWIVQALAFGSLFHVGRWKTSTA